MTGLTLYERSVFINCPFDARYWPLLEAITFVVMQCGFVPRCSLETEDSSQVRIQKINNLIADCRLAIHDISRTESDGIPPMPRFNMPLELGIFMGAKEFGDREQRRKAAVILDVEQYRYQRFVSDIAGQDIRAHGGEIARVVGHVRNFLLAHTPPSILLPGPDHLAQLYREFRSSLAAACSPAYIQPEELTFVDLSRWIRGYMNA